MGLFRIAWRKPCISMSLWKWARNVIGIVDNWSYRVVEHLSAATRTHAFVTEGNKVISHTSMTMSGLRKHGVGKFAESG